MGAVRKAAGHAASHLQAAGRLVACQVRTLVSLPTGLACRELATVVSPFCSDVLSATAKSGIGLLPGGRRGTHSEAG